LLANGTTFWLPIFFGDDPVKFEGIEMNSITINWLILLSAGLFEIVWAIGLKYTDGFTRFWPSVITAAAMLISVTLLGISMKTLPVGTAYAVWVGVGAIGTAILGIILFNESASVARMFSLLLILLGIIGLKLSTPT
jgi:quaternary ammonium compound-resistance protein SugE